ncbi:methylated-DNA--[protein]-cysteine S-methyltransferase [Komagataeibacter sp. FNDCF1]|uniref:methylated-DNA--[protein]-cysteine S-methyltransferase n=1 Tax=Komagataeibacter sp. FNDCF1 TaxID=2878681 RepID=UPI001E46583A|nr:methylated-DNA--[protein]-cysteine S-methyltransferase [Komagataeibacter sp. FNDCF1]MCE2563456.1 methylated-DNA--[protein]-cysteine S-methyltransferase [Komagataeibacter sp. FNDCF1]
MPADGTPLRVAIGQSSLGAVLVGMTGNGIAAIMLDDDGALLLDAARRLFPTARQVHGDRSLNCCMKAVQAHINTPCSPFDLPLDMQGTPFQQQVWQALRTIPCGTTLSYTELAARIGRPAAVRAVAGACGANRLAVVIPCHRVIGRNGSLSGYRWGTGRKRRLLEMERAVPLILRGAA